MCLRMFHDKQLLALFVFLWTVVSPCVFIGIMVADQSPFLSFGPNTRTRLIGRDAGHVGKMELRRSVHIRQYVCRSVCQ